MSFGNSTKKPANSSSMNTVAAIRQELIDVLPDVLRQTVKVSAKVLAFNTGMTSRGVEQIKASQHIASLPTAIAIARQYPEFRQWLVRYIEAQTGENDEDPGYVLNEIQRLLIARGRL